MPIPDQVQDYLSENAVSYQHKTHPVAYTSQEIAAIAHVPGDELAKTVVLRADGCMIMAVLSAARIINMEALKETLRCKQLELVPESEFINRFPACRPGAMPPFGKLFGLPCYWDKWLAKELEIEFNAGTHMDTIRMSSWEFERLEAPFMFDFSEKRQKKASGRAA